MALFRRKHELEKALKTVEKYGWAFGGGSGWFSTSSNIPMPGRLGSGSSLVTLSSAFGLPAVTAVVRLFGQMTGTVPLCVYEGEPDERSKARESWQWYRLHEQPNEEQSAFEFFQDVETSIKAAGNAWVWKSITRRPVREPEDVELFVIDPGICRSVREDGRKVFKIREGGQESTYGPDKVLHVRGWTPFLGVADAPSPIGLHMDTIGSMLDRQSYETTFYTNNAQTQIALVHPEFVPDEEAREIVDRFVQQHTGSNAYRPALVSGGGDIKTLSIPQREQQYVEQKQVSVEDAARIFGLSAVDLVRQIQGGPSTNDVFERFLKVDLAPELRRIETALKRDRDLFPDDELFPEFLTDAVLKPDIQTRYTAYKDAIQGGWITADEIRLKENMPTRGGAADELQETPVGGAPNRQGSNGQVQEPSYAG